MLKNEKDRRIKKVQPGIRLYDRNLLVTIRYLYNIIRQDSLFSDNEYLKVIVDFGENTQSDDTETSVVIGYCYRFGKGVESDEDKSFAWFKKAAEKGNPCGQHYLGICYYMGQGIAQDYIKAFELQSLAAAQGHAGAMYDIASAYYYGYGVEKNENIAVEWLKKAMKYGNDAAEVFLKGIVSPEFVSDMNAEIEAEMRELKYLDD